MHHRPDRSQQEFPQRSGAELSVVQVPGGDSMKRLNLRNRECPKCGGKIGVLKRATKDNPTAWLGCVSGTHVQVQGTHGYDADDFPKKVKPPSKKEIDKFIASVRYQLANSERRELRI